MLASISSQFLEFFSGADASTTVELGTSVGDLAARLLFGLLLGALVSVSYIISNKKNYSRTFAITLVALPSLVAAIIWMVGSDITKAISLGGLFTLIKFRSVPGDSKDILNVLIAMAIGLAVGLGVYPIAVIMAVTMVIVMVALNLSPYAKKHSDEKQLRITVPESLNFEGVFEEVLPKYTTKYSLDSIKTSHMGTMFELTYTVCLKEGTGVKAMIDDLRTRNGNLQISLTAKPSEKVASTL